MPFEFGAEYERAIRDFLSLVETQVPAEVTNVHQDRENGFAPAAVNMAGTDGAADGYGITRAGFEEPRLPLQKASPVIINYAALGEVDPALCPEPAPAIKKADRWTTQSPAATAPVLVAEEPPKEQAHVRSVPDLCTRRVVVNLPLVNDLFIPIDGARFDAPAFTIQTPPPASSPLRSKVVFGPSPQVSISAVADELPHQHEIPISYPPGTSPSAESGKLVEAGVPAAEDEHGTAASDTVPNSVIVGASENLSNDAALSMGAALEVESCTKSLDYTTIRALKMAMELESGSDFEASKKPCGLRY